MEETTTEPHATVGADITIRDCQSPPQRLYPKTLEASETGVASLPRTSENMMPVTSVCRLPPYKKDM